MIFDRLMGSETEFGVICPGRPGAHETVMSALVVDSCPLTAEAGWDYSGETPLADARGREMPEDQAHPTQLTHRSDVLTSEDIAREMAAETPEITNARFWENAVMNRVLPNGARFYVDHAHPECSSPETTHPWDAMVWDAAGDVVGRRAAEQVAVRYGERWPEPILLYKNNTDNKSVSYGFHENYTVPRALDFGRLVEGFAPYLATRQVVVGAGRAGLGAERVRPGFQISQRADFFERLVGLETTVRRPIVNTRDEPHADAERYRRLHVIPGDANLSQTSALLKFASAAAVLTLVEHGAEPRLELAEPVAAMQAISHDPELRTRVALADGRRLTGVEIQRSLFDAALDLADRLGGLAERDRRILQVWGEVLEALASDPLSLADRLDWVAKYALVLGYRERGVDVGSPKIQALDLQYADLRPEKSLYRRLVAAGRMRTLVEESEIDAAVRTPPATTRAHLRGTLVRRWPEQVVSAGWEVVAVEDPASGRVRRWLMDEPRRWTREETDEVLAGAASADEALRRLAVRRLD